MAAMAKWGNKKWKINSQQVVGIQNISFLYAGGQHRKFDRQEKQKKTSAKAKKKEEKQKETESFFLVLRNADPQRYGGQKCIC